VVTRLLLVLGWLLVYRYCSQACFLNMLSHHALGCTEIAFCKSSNQVLYTTSGQHSAMLVACLVRCSAYSCWGAVMPPVADKPLQLPPALQAMESVCKQRYKSDVTALM
jgi:hypothetical protein